MDDSNQSVITEETISPVPRLDDLCVQVISENFSDFPVLDSLPPCYVQNVIDAIDYDAIQIDVIAQRVNSEKFWRRLCEHLPSVNAKGSSSSWKRTFLEANLQELLENFQPKVDASHSWDELQKVIDASKPFVQKLSITQFLEPIQVHSILQGFPNLASLHVTYGMRQQGMRYGAFKTGMKLDDAVSIGKLLQNTRTLNKLRLPLNDITDDILHLCIPGLQSNDTLTHVDLSGNHIGDLGAQRLGAWLEQPGVLTVLNLADNNIRAEGGSYLGASLEENTNLLTLNLALNRLGDNGTTTLLQHLANNDTLTELDVSGNGAARDAAVELLVFVSANQVCEVLNLSGNPDLFAGSATSLAPKGSIAHGAQCSGKDDEAAEVMSDGEAQGDEVRNSISAQKDQDPNGTLVPKLKLGNNGNSFGSENDARMMNSQSASALRGKLSAIYESTNGESDPKGEDLNDDDGQTISAKTLPLEEELVKRVQFENGALKRVDVRQTGCQAATLEALQNALWDRQILEKRESRKIRLATPRLL